MSDLLEGHCLCGAVTVRAHSHDKGVSVCHCAMCRRWSGAALWIVEAPHVDASGPVQRWRSSPFAERAWCGRCGSHLWIRDDDGAYDLMPGLFDAAADLPLIREIYIDRAIAGAPLSGDHPRQTAAAYEAENPFVPEGDMP